MSFRYLKGQKATAATAITGAAPQSLSGSALAVNGIDRGSMICADIVMNVRTSNLTMTPKWQGSDDGSTYYDIKLANNPAAVATAAGTGSDVATTISLGMACRPPFKWVRAVVTTGGSATGTANDTASVSYRFVRASFTNE